MTRFSYQVLSKEHEELTGYIEASSDAEAKEKLEKLGYEVLQLVPSSAVFDEPVLKKTFTFQAYNPQGQKISGTIKSVDAAHAEQKLIEAYHLTDIHLQEDQSAKVAKNTSAEEIEKYKHIYNTVEKGRKFIASISENDTTYNSFFEVLDRLIHQIHEKSWTLAEETSQVLLAMMQATEKDVLEQHEKEQEESLHQETSYALSSMHTEVEEATTDIHFYITGFLREISILGTWLLVFYALYFSFVEMMVSQNLPFLWKNEIAMTLSTPLLFKMTAVVLLFTLVARFIIRYFSKNIPRMSLLGGICILCCLWIISL